jgi:hypothetical protein
VELVVRLAQDAQDVAGFLVIVDDENCLLGIGLGHGLKPLAAGGFCPGVRILAKKVWALGDPREAASSRS